MVTLSAMLFALSFLMHPSPRCRITKSSWPILQRATLFFLSLRIHFGLHSMVSLRTIPLWTFLQLTVFHLRDAGIRTRRSSSTSELWKICMLCVMSSKEVLPRMHFLFRSHFALCILPCSRSQLVGPGISPRSGSVIVTSWRTTCFSMCCKNISCPIVAYNAVLF
ncbi:hypothetical protein BC936DRAFT_144233 [Jimgerdemannia flammicorona]|uniref:Uncharacterized protein n=1 Tax=Jimgerdemannia flammicorona TaxID=994334 RepID=A0A433DCS5_9FUNG|nr:hypothetical protein BC936DRAFT_144233 [Jimgerdemannia flammicorona]